MKKGKAAGEDYIGPIAIKLEFSDLHSYSHIYGDVCEL